MKDELLGALVTQEEIDAAHNILRYIQSGGIFKIARAQPVIAEISFNLSACYAYSYAVRALLPEFKHDVHNTDTVQFLLQRILEARGKLNTAVVKAKQI